ncbi:cob(I)yrinic acid a,c-diamide adenosyltransferase, partial [Patescibacteria group bacterium]|nr:cob(I)yrinic acid a,c-diamide adenosyltransferase [Patescibacteria group bacterium]MBU1907748.1 cob(I)yrinic acid a,c-diamide adenosyltransferase [Patescibacteria group bacterium]
MDEINTPQPTGMLHVYTGNGKGKTTAAVGLAIRAAGAGKRVTIIAFDKGGEGHYFERDFIRQRIPEIVFFATGCDRIDPKTQKFRFGVTTDDRAEGERGLKIARDLMMQARFDIMILDEINSSTALKIVDEAAVIRLLDERPRALELILTGRQAPESFIERAD